MKAGFMRWVLGAAALILVAPACQQPFGLGTPAERALENGAAGTLDATSYEMTGSYTVAADRWTIDMQVARPADEHLVITSSKGKVEAIISPNGAYFRGQEFLAQHMGSDPLSQSVVKAAGNAWWKGSVGFAPRVADLTSGRAFTATFLGSAVTRRTDQVSADGIAAVELSGARADVYVAAAPPYQLLRVQTKPGVVIDGVTDADLHYGNVGHDFGIKAPPDVIDFSNLSTLPPIYTVVSVDTAGCGSPCVVAAQLKNLGGMSGATAPSTVTFTMTESASGRVVGTCQAAVEPDVGYNSTTTVSCTIAGTGAQQDAATVTAVANNPGRAPVGTG